MTRVLVTAMLLPAVSVVLACRNPRAVPKDVGLDDGRYWLDAGETPTPASPALLRAAAASAVNKGAVSENPLQEIIRTQPASDAARGRTSCCRVSICGPVSTGGRSRISMRGLARFLTERTCG